MDHAGRPGSARPGTLVVLEPVGGPVVGPQEGRVLWFGRNRPDVHICVGPDDLGVSRRHGTLEFTAGRWWVRTLGERPVRVGGTQVLRRGDEPIPLAEGSTSLLVPGADPRDLHVVRVRVVGAVREPRGSIRASAAGAGTVPVPCLALDATERLVMAVIAQRHLLHQPDAEPLTSREAAAELATLQPAAGWTQKKVEHLVRKVRDRFSAREGIPRLKPEPGQPAFDSVYRRNLIVALLDTGTLGAADVRLLGLEA